MRLLKWIFNFLNPISAKYPVKDLSFAIVLGFLLGMSPILSPISVLIFFIWFFRRLHTSSIILGYLIAYGFKQLIVLPAHELGLSVLQYPELSDFYTKIYNTVWGQLSSFYNTLVIGTFIVGIVLFFPLFLTFNRLIPILRKKIEQKRQTKKIAYNGLKEKGKEKLASAKKKKITDFVILVTSIVVGYMVLIQPLSKKIRETLEEQLSSFWGSEVSVNSVTFGVNPIGFSLKNIEFPDNENLDRNKFQIEKISFYIDLFHLAMGRFVVNELSVSDIFLDVPRRTPGRLLKETEKSSSEEELSIDMSTDVFIDPKDLLKQSSLKVTEASKDYEKVYKSLDKKWKEITKTLVTKDQLEQYKSELKGLQSNISVKQLGGALKQKEKYQAIMGRVASDMKSLQKAKSFIGGGLTDIVTKKNQLKQLALKDYESLIGKYDHKPFKAVENLLALLVSKQYQKDIEEWSSYYRILEPYIEEYMNDTLEVLEEPIFEGKNVKFQETDPQPVFNIRMMHSSGSLGKGEYKLIGRDVVLPIGGSLKASYQPENNPVTFNLGYKSVWEDSLAVKILRIFCEDYRVSDWKLINNKQFMVEIDSADASVEAGFRSLKGGLEGAIMLIYKNVKFKKMSSQGSWFQKALEEVLQRKDAFHILIELSGSIAQPEIAIKTDLDSSLHSELNNVLKERTEKLKRELKSEIDKKMLEGTKILDDYKGKLLELQNKLVQDEALIKNLKSFDLEESVKLLKKENPKDILNSVKKTEGVNSLIKKIGF